MSLKTWAFAGLRLFLFHFGRHFLLLPVVGLSISLVLTVAKADSVSFTRDVVPILQANCVGCHKPGKSKGKLDLSTYEAILRGGEAGAILKAGHPEESSLVEQIIGNPPSMPEEGEPLKSSEIEIIRRWIAEGAKNDSQRSLPTSAEVPVYKSLPSVAALAFSPDGTLLAVAGHREVLLYEVRGSNVVGRLVGNLPRIESLAFSPDGKRMGVAASEPSVGGEIQLWDISKRENLRTIKLANDSLYGISFSPDGSKISVGGADKLVRIIEVETGRELAKADTHSDWVMGTVFTTDGKYVASGSRDKTVRVIDAATGRFLSDLNPQWESINSLAVHPQRPEIVYGGETGGVRVYKLAPDEGFKDPGENKLHVRDYDNLGGPVYALAYSKDGEWIAIGGASKEVRVHKSKDGHRVATLRGHEGAVFSLAFHPDGKMLATGGLDGNVRFYKLPAGELDCAFASVPLSNRRE